MQRDVTWTPEPPIRAIDAKDAATILWRAHALDEDLPDDMRWHALQVLKDAEGMPEFLPDTLGCMGDDWVFADTAHLTDALRAARAGNAAEAVHVLAEAFPESDAASDLIRRICDTLETQLSQAAQ